jgi:hypothetical protein
MDTMPLEDRQDAKYFSVKLEDPSIKAEMEGGYVVSRPRHTRTPRRTWTTGFTDLSNAERLTLESFWNTQRGGSEIFLWKNKVDNVYYQVRFTKPMEFKYAGFGTTYRWDCPNIELEQA